MAAMNNHRLQLSCFLTKKVATRRPVTQERGMKRNFVTLDKIKNIRLCFAMGLAMLLGLVFQRCAEKRENEREPYSVACLTISFLTLCGKSDNPSHVYAENNLCG